MGEGRGGGGGRTPDTQKRGTVTPIRNILVADKNPHVRKLICRELQGAGFQARSVSTCREVIQWTESGQWADLLVIDPELPDFQPGELLDKTVALRPDMIVIVHAFGEPPQKAGTTSNAPRYIEKTGNSIPRLVQMVQTINTHRLAAVSSPAPANAPEKKAH